MKTYLKLAALFAAMLISTSTFAASKGLPDEEPQTPPPAVAPAAAPDSVQQELKACVEDLATAKTNSSEFLKRAEACEKKYCDIPENKKKDPICTGVAPKAPKPKAPPPPPKPTTCETPDKQVLPAENGSCVEECADSTHLGTPDHVAVRGLTPTAQICVVRRVTFADLTGRVEALEHKYDDLASQLAALAKLTGDQYTALFGQLTIVVTELQDHEQRIAALEAWRKAKDAKDAEQDEGIAKAQADANAAKKNRSVQLVRPELVITTGGAGDAGWHFALGGRLEYENRFTADSIASFYAGVGAAVAPVHQDNTFGTIYMPFVDAGVRIHTSDSHELGIDIGAMYEVRLDGHPAGWMGKPSQYDGSNFGPEVALMWNFHQFMHARLGGKLGFGPENHFDQAGNAIALEYPVQPAFFLQVGGTIGLGH